MRQGTRWVVAAIAAAALVGLLLFARGQPDRGGPSTSPVATPAALTVVPPA